MGENVEEALANPAWRCPVCRDICNCSGVGCQRARRDLAPTNQLHSEAQNYGWQSVAHYLIITELKQGRALEMVEREVDERCVPAAWSRGTQTERALAQAPPQARRRVCRGASCGSPAYGCDGARRRASSAACQRPRRTCARVASACDARVWRQRRRRWRVCGRLRSPPRCGPPRRVGRGRRRRG